MSKRAKRKRRQRKRPLQAAARPRVPTLTAWPVPVEVRAAEQQDPNARRRFKLQAYTGEPLDLWQYEYPVVIDVETLDASRQDLPALLDHMSYEGCIVGQIDRVSIEGGGGKLPPVTAEGYFTPTTDPRDAGAFVLAKADAGFKWQASVGCKPGNLDRVEAGQTAKVNGRTYPGPVIVARNCVLREISFVVLGADRNSRAVLASGSSPMTFEEWLTSMGFDSEAQSALTEIQRSNLLIKYQEEYPEADDTGTDPATNAADDMTDDDEPAPAAAADDMEDDEPAPATNARARPPALRGSIRGTAGRPARGNADQPDPVERQRQRAAAEEERQAAIRARAAESQITEIDVRSGNRRERVNLVAHAIRAGWHMDRVELEILRAERGSGPNLITRDHDRDCTIQALQGAMVLRAGGRLDHPAYQSPRAIRLVPSWLRAGLNDAQRNRFMDAAHQYADLHAMDLCREALRIEGRQIPRGRNDLIQAAFSGMTLTNVFTTNINAILLATYMEAPDTTAGWTSEQDVADFRTNERPRIEKGAGLNVLPRGAAADHMTREDAGESYKINRFAGQVVVDEQDFIDDNLGALSDLPVEMGMAAARLRPDLVYSILLANPTLATTGRALFNATDGNDASGAALAAATLRAACSSMMARQENGVNLNLMPTHLIVPTTLFFQANELVQSVTIVIAGTAGSVTERGTKNVLSDLNLTVVSDGRLENGVTDPKTKTSHAGSSTKWYLGSTMAHTIEVGYLRGTGRAPQTTPWRKQGEEGQWLLGWSVKHDIGAKELDWKGFERRDS